LSGFVGVTRRPLRRGQHLIKDDAFSGEPGFPLRLHRAG